MQNRQSRLSAVCIVTALLFISAVDAFAADQDNDSAAVRFFEAKVRPVLVEHCLKCHGGEKTKAGLRVDSREALLRGGDSGVAIVPGKTDSSLLIQAIRHEHAEIKMPPKKNLPAPAIAALEQWIQSGAVWPKSKQIKGTQTDPIDQLERIKATHWSFQPIRKPALPTLSELPGDANAIDRFIVARLKAKNLKPSPPASKRALIRRAYFDLIGLPPTYEQVKAFEADDAPDALSKVIDELLARREYGQRWGRHWLDVARYSDTKGYVDAGERRYAFAYTYRDYVIRAFNEDKAFDQFIMEQLAADRLGDDTDPRNLAALGFLTVGQRFNFFPHEIIDDRIDVVTRGFMGLTVTCARCHHHKYDPIATDDYYSLYGVFKSSFEPVLDDAPVIGPASADGKAIEKLKIDLKAKREIYDKRRHDLHHRIMLEMRGHARDYLVYMVQLMPEHRTEPQPPMRTKRGVIREQSAYGSGGVVRWRRFIAQRGKDDAVFGLWNRLVVMTPTEIKASTPSVLADFKKKNAINLLLRVQFEEKPPSNMVDVAENYGRVLEDVYAQWIERTKAKPDATAFGDPALDAIRDVLFASDAPGTVTLDESEDLYLLDEHSDMRKKQADVERVFLGQQQASDRAMVLLDRTKPIEPRILVRGDKDRPGRQVARRFLRVLPEVGSKPFADGSGRLELAKAIVHRDNPLTARVIVNRVWQWHFGQGLAATSSDFGTRSQPPSHPELLDYLAADFVEHGWSIKRLHRQIMSSRTYQQSSDDRTDGRAVDPVNRLLWRMNRHRIGFEAMRDSMLFATGQLKTDGGGRPIMTALDDPANVNRTVYCDVDREKLPGLMRVFDFPSPDLSSSARPRTTVPQQALFMLNSPFVIGVAKGIVQRVERDHLSSNPTDKVNTLFRLALGRDPSKSELVLALKFVSVSTASESEQVKSQKPQPWKYGYGRYDLEKKKLNKFTPLPYFTGEAWQGGESWPSKPLNYLRLTAIGGHVGIDHDHAAVRRWVSPVDGVIDIVGSLYHGHEDCGDGVRAWIVSSRGGQLGHWTANEQRLDTSINSVNVKIGDTIDFIVDCNKEHTCDMFDWSPTIRLLGNAAKDQRNVWHATKDFEGERTIRKPLSRWVQFAQVLLQSNEFMFVD